MPKRFNFHLSSITSLILAALKLSDYIDWSWWIIFAPALLGIVVDLYLILHLFLEPSSKDDLS